MRSFWFVFLPFLPFLLFSQFTTGQCDSSSCGSGTSCLCVGSTTLYASDYDRCASEQGSGCDDGRCFSTGTRWLSDVPVGCACSSDVSCVSGRCSEDICVDFLPPGITVTPPFPSHLLGVGGSSEITYNIAPQSYADVLHVYLTATGRPPEGTITLRYGDQTIQPGGSLSLVIPEGVPAMVILLLNGTTSFTTLTSSFSSDYNVRVVSETSTLESTEGGSLTIRPSSLEGYRVVSEPSLLFYVLFGVGLLLFHRFLHHRFNFV